MARRRQVSQPRRRRHASGGRCRQPDRRLSSASTRTPVPPSRHDRAAARLAGRSPRAHRQVPEAGGTRSWSGETAGADVLIRSGRRTGTGRLDCPARLSQRGRGGVPDPVQAPRRERARAGRVRRHARGGTIEVEQHPRHEPIRSKCRTRASAPGPGPRSRQAWRSSGFLPITSTSHKIRYVN